MHHLDIVIHENIIKTNPEHKLIYWSLSKNISRKTILSSNANQNTENISKEAVNHTI
jgi:hypothetical protein